MTMRICIVMQAPEVVLMFSALHIVVGMSCIYVCVYIYTWYDIRPVCKTLYSSDSLCAGASAYLLGEGEDWEEEQPAVPLPQCVEEWLATFTSWSAEYKAVALNGIISV